MTSSRRLQRKRKAYARFYFFCRNISVFILVAFCFVVGLSAGVWLSIMKFLPNDSDLGDINPPAPSRVFASDGTLLGRLYEENRDPIELDKMGLVVKATVSIEDVRFYTHPGFDVIGIGRAGLKNIASKIFHSATMEGASTITQQLARNLYLTNQRSIARKLQEIAIALEIEKRYSKEEILETYLNQIYYGSNPNRLRSYGIMVASNVYFGVDPDKLTLSQAALLAGLPKNPSGYDPYKFYDRAVLRRDTVLKNMYRNGFITEKEYTEARAEKIKLLDPPARADSTLNSPAPYFIDYLLHKELVEIFGQDNVTDLIYGNGVDIYTTLDPKLQKTAGDVVRKQVIANKSRKIDEGALITLDARTGAIKAMVGGIDYGNSKFNVVTQGRRQPGSSYKPIVYTTALLRGYTADTIVLDEPITLGSWSPKNSNGSYSGQMRLSSAVEQSKNVVAVRVAQDVGIDNVIKTAEAMGIKTKQEPYLSTALGASVVTPLELCSAYSVLANKGVYNTPYSVEAVVRGGTVIYENKKSPKRVLPIKIAEGMTKILRGAVERGTGTAARSRFPVSGKTGTTNSYRDAWFIGYTENLVTAVWVGNRDNSEMNRTFGGTIPAPIWREYMAVAQPIIAAEHAKNIDELNRLNNLRDGTKLNETASPYINQKGERRVGMPQENSTYQNRDVELTE